jgi:TolA-binding protein
MELIRRFPSSPQIPAALYFLGYSRAARGESELALRHFEDLAARFPESPYAQQALIFVGEHYFNENDLARAESAYDQVLDHPDSKYFDQALYKLAWTRYRSNTYKSAISSFTYILEESQRNPDRKGKSLLTQESLQYTALSLAESDTTGDGGFTQTQAFGQRLGDPRIGAQLLHKMAGIYLQQGRLERAKRALGSLLQGYPGYSELPAAMVELAQAFDKEQNFTQGAEVREKILTQYGPGSEWYAGLTSNATRAYADSVVERSMDDLARHYLYEAKRVATAAPDAAEKRVRAYRKAISGYERFLAAYPEHPRATRYAYQQAEAYYAMQDYTGATRKYLQVSRGGHSKLSTIAAYNAIVAAQELIRKGEEEKGEAENAKGQGEDDARK